PLPRLRGLLDEQPSHDARLARLAGIEIAEALFGTGMDRPRLLGNPVLRGPQRPADRREGRQELHSRSRPVVAVSHFLRPAGDLLPEPPDVRLRRPGDFLEEPDRPDESSGDLADSGDVREPVHLPAALAGRAPLLGDRDGADGTGPDPLRQAGSLV